MSMSSAGFAPAALLVFAMSAAPSHSVAGLSASEMARAIEFGQRCAAPILRIEGKRGQDFDVYVESPVGRAALAVATATMMHVPLDAVVVKRAMQSSDYRIWAAYVIGSSAKVSVRQIVIHETTGTEIAPLGHRYERFFVGLAPSHGIIEPLRDRFDEAIFDRVPDGNFDVVLRTTAGNQIYHVTHQTRGTLLHVCNN
jgi:hypothetical protein